VPCAAAPCPPQRAASEAVGVGLVTALALVLIAEGLMPLLSPRRWRAMFERVMRFNDGQLRFLGLVFVLAGVLLLWF
jgi:uncharacterized protein